MCIFSSSTTTTNGGLFRNGCACCTSNAYVKDDGEIKITCSDENG